MAGEILEMSAGSKANTDVPGAAPSEPRTANSQKRRAGIVAALRHCVLEKGYAETSLTDLAKAAKMSVSHLLYYYEGKEAVLLDVARQLNEQIFVDVATHHDEPPEERIHVLVDNVFVRGAITRSELGLIREILALAGHKPALRAALEGYNRRMTGYLEDLFSKTPRQAGLSAEDAAETAAALWVGLAINTDFDKHLGISRARRLFRQSLFSLANLDSTKAPSARTQAGNPARPRRSPPNSPTGEI
jgi:AcrR family transcriptional regulator